MSNLLRSFQIYLSGSWEILFERPLIGGGVGGGLLKNESKYELNLTQTLIIEDSLILEHRDVFY